MWVQVPLPAPPFGRGATCGSASGWRRQPGRNPPTPPSSVLVDSSRCITQGDRGPPRHVLAPLRAHLPLHADAGSGPRRRNLANTTTRLDARSARISALGGVRGRAKALRCSPLVRTTGDASMLAPLESRLWVGCGGGRRRFAVRLWCGRPGTHRCSLRSNLGFGWDAGAGAHDRKGCESRIGGSISVSTAQGPGRAPSGSARRRRSTALRKSVQVPKRRRYPSR